MGWHSLARFLIIQAIRTIAKCLRGLPVEDYGRSSRLNIVGANRDSRNCRIHVFHCL